MPPSEPSEDLPGLRPASSRKRKETRRFREDADPPLLKRKKVSSAREPTEVPTHSSPSTRKSSVGPGNTDDDRSDSNEHPVDLEKNSEPVDISDEDGEDEARALSDEEEKESTEAEMSKPVAGLNPHY